MQKVTSKRTKKAVADKLVIRGFYRVAIYDYGPNGEPNHKLVSDSGLCGPNQMTNIGFLNYIAYILGASAGSALVSYAALGTGTTPASNTGGLPGEVVQVTDQRRPVTTSFNGSTQIQMIASWASGYQTVTTPIVLQNAGLYALSQTSNQSLMCGKTYATQTWASNQSAALTYQLNLSAS
jgi:hypothetical protein